MAEEIEITLRNLMWNIDNFSEELPNVTERTVATVGSLLDSKTIEFEKDLLIACVFSEDFGIHRFLQKAAKKNCKDAVKHVLDLFKKLIEYRSSFFKYSSKIFEAAKQVLLIMESSSANKSLALEVMTSVIKGGNVDQEEVIKSIDVINNMLYRLSGKDSSVLKSVFQLIGIIAEFKYEDVIKYNERCNHKKHIMEVFMEDVRRKLEEMDPRHETGRKSILEGCFDALIGLFKHYTYSSDTYERIYNFTKREISMENDGNRKVHQRSALKLIRKHAKKMSSFICEEYKFWHKELLKWIKNNNNDNKKAGYDAYIELLKEIASVLLKNPDVSFEKDKEIFMFFMNYFMGNLKKVNIAEEKEVGITIIGIKEFACVFSKFMEPKEIDNLFARIMHRASNAGQLEKEDQGPLQVFQYLKALSSISCVLKGTLTRCQLDVVQQFVVLIIEQHSDRDVKYQKDAIHSVAENLFSMSICIGPAEFQDYLDFIVYQSLMRSYKPSIPLENLNQEGEKYFRLWKELFLIHADTNFRKDLSNDVKLSLVTQIYDSFISAIMRLFNKLDVSIKKKDSNNNDFVSDPEAALEPNNEVDFAILCYLSALCVNVFENVKDDLNYRSLEEFLKDIVVLSSRNYLVSSFYDVFAAILKITEKIDFFMNEKYEGSEECKRIVINYLEDILINLFQYPTKIQVPCLKVITAAPVVLISDLMYYLPDAFKVVFRIGHGELKLAHCGIDALERWIGELTNDQLKPFLNEVVPQLHPFLHGRTVINPYLFGDSSGALPSKRSQRFKKVAELQANSDFIESELSKLQKRILGLLGRLDSPFLLSLLNQDHTNLVIPWNLFSFLELEVKFPNLTKSPVIYLDGLALRAMELALTSGDRKTRATAYEVLHAIFIIFLGQTSSSRRTLDSALDFLEKLLPGLFELACSFDVIANEMFEPLLLQACHWYSGKICCRNDSQLPYVEKFIEAIFNALTSSSDHSIRDMGAKCLCEYVSWAVKQLSESDLKKCPLNIKSVIQRLNLYCLHPCPFKREGAALGFNALYKQLREKKSIVNTFWLEILYHFVKSLSFSNNSKQVLDAIDHISRVLVEQPGLFNKQSAERRRPSEFSGILLKDAVHWLLTQCSSTQILCQQKSMELFEKLAPLINGCISTEDFLQQILHDNEKTGFSNLVVLFEGGGKEKIFAASPTFDCIETLIEWLNHIFSAVSCYTWLLKSKINVLNIILSPESRLLEALQYFVKEVSCSSAGKIIEKLSGTNVPVILTTRETDKFSHVKCKLSLAVFDFILELKEGVTWFCDNCWNSDFNLWVTRCIISPALIGFDNMNKVYADKLNPTLLRLLNTISHSSKEALVNCLSTELRTKQNEIWSALSDSIQPQNEQSVVLAALPYLINHGLDHTIYEQYINALLILEESGLLIFVDANAWCYDDWMQGNVFENILNVITDQAVRIEKDHAFRSYLLSVVHFVFQFETDVDKCFSAIFRLELNRKKRFSAVRIIKPLYDAIIEHLLSDVAQTVTSFSELFERLMNEGWDSICDLVEFMNRLLITGKNQPEDVKVKLIEELCSKWIATFLTSLNLFKYKTDALSVISNLISLFPKQNIRECNEMNEVVNFLFNELKDRYKTLEYKSLFLELLPALVKPTSNEFDSSLWDVLTKFRCSHFPLNSNEFKRGSQNRVDYVYAFRKLLKAFTQTCDSTVLKTIINTAAGDSNHPCVDAISECLRHFRKFDGNKQLNVLNTVYGIFMDDKNSNALKKLAVVEQFLVPLLNECIREDVIKDFFGCKIQELFQIISDQKLIPGNKKAEEYAYKASAFVLCEAMFSHISKEYLTLDDNIIGQKIEEIISRSRFKSYKPSQCYKQFIVCACDCRKKELPKDASEEVESLYYSHQCAAYNLLIKVVSLELLPVDKTDVHDRLLFDSTIWEKLVPCHKVYQFSMDFDKLPEKKKQFAGVRRTMRNEREANTSTSSVNTSASYSSYSQALFRSTLFEDLTKFDFSYAMVQNYEDISNNLECSHLDKTVIMIEADVLNNHKCMPELCYLISYLSKQTPTVLTQQSSSTSMSEPQQGSELPFWMKRFHDILLGKGHKKNVRLFILKLLINCQEYFKGYGEHFTSPVIQTILDGCVGDSLNYVISDAIKMIVSWANTTGVPKNVENISRLFAFVFDSTAVTSNDLFKFSVEILRDIIEAWRLYIEVPHDNILQKLRCSDKEPIKRKAALEMIAILLFYNIQPFTDNNKELFYNSLISLLWKDNNVRDKSPEAIGLFYKFLTKNGTEELSEEDKIRANNLVDIIKEKLGQLSKTTDGLTKMLKCLHSIQRHYPSITKCFSELAVSWLPKFQTKMCCYVLEIILSCLDSNFEETGTLLLMQEHYRTLIRILKLSCAENQPLSLKVIKKILPLLNGVQLESSIDEIVTLFTEHKNLECREIMYDILISMYNNSFLPENLHEKVRVNLLKGFQDPDEKLRNKMLTFWREKRHLNNNLYKRTIEVFKKLYAVEYEQNFIGSAVSLLLDVCSSCEEKLFKEPLSECQMEEMKINTSYCYSNAGPLFLQSVSNRMNTLSLADGISSSPSFSNTAATVEKSWGFQPTLEQDIHSRQSSFIPSSLVGLSSFQSRPTLSYDKSIQRSYKDIHSSSQGTQEHSFLVPQLPARKLKNKKEVSREIAGKHRLQNEELENVISRKKAKFERDVTLTRHYRKGDFPDIEITFSAVIKNLQDLSEKDPTFASQLMICLLETIIKSNDNNKVEYLADETEANQDEEHFVNNLSSLFEGMLNHTNISSVASTILEVAVKFSSQFKISPVIITEVSKRCGVSSLGALLLEDKLKLDLNSTEPPPTKKSRTEMQSNDDVWAQLAHVYRNMDEDDVVQGIFEEKLASLDARNALESEAAGRLKKASQLYKNLIRSATKLDDAKADFLYEAYFKCLAKMSSWNDLNKLISEQVDNTLDDLWDESNKDCLLPWMFSSGLHCYFDDPHATNNLIECVMTEWVKDKKKNDFMRSHFGQQLALFYLFKGKEEEAKAMSHGNITQFLDDWSELPQLARNLLVNKCFQLQSLMEIDSFLDSKLLPGAQSNKLGWEKDVMNFVNKWQSNSPSSYDSLIFWETRTKYRLYFCSLLHNQAQVFNEVNVIEKLSTVSKSMWFTLLDCALSQNNYHLAKKVCQTAPKKFFRENDEGTLKISKTRLLLAKEYTDEIFNRIKCGFSAWNELEPLENVSNQALKLSVKCHETEIWKDIFFCLQKYPEKWNELRNYLRKEKSSLFSELSFMNCDNVEIVIEHLYERGLMSLKEATEISEELYAVIAKNDTEKRKYAKDAAETYLSLTKYCLLQKNSDQSQTNEILIKSLFRSMRYGSTEARQLFPCLLDLPTLPINDKEVFISECEKVPEWMFLLWVNQLLANLDTRIGITLQPLLLRLARAYPVALQIPFHISSSKYTNSYSETKDFVGELQKMLSYDDVTKNLLYSLNFLRIPQTTLQNFLIQIRSRLIKDNLSDLAKPFWDELFEVSFMNPRDAFKGPLYDQNKQYKKPVEDIYQKIQNGCQKEIMLKELHGLITKIEIDSDSKKKKFMYKLKDVSMWLDKFNRLIGDIEIPGQYTGDSKPFPSLHIRISKFTETIKVMTSIRSPVKIGIIGHDGIERGFLLKCGEDLRQDQRIQQLFKLMNQILINDNSTGRNLNIGTYNVIPLTSNLGLISWIDKTLTYDQFTQLSLSPDEKKIYKNQPKEFEERILNALGIMKKDCNSIPKMYALMYLHLNKGAAVSVFRQIVSALEDNIFCRSVQKLSQSSVAYHYLRSQFGSSLAVMNICHWILGIGDRHLENTLVRMTDGQLFGIDFGHAFGSATQNLDLPELIPFRLTPKILNLFSPFNETGLLRETMVHCLTSLRKYQHVLMAAMNIFIQEPTLNWLDLANKKAKENEKYEIGTTGVWSPAQIIKLAERKLAGSNPMFIMLEELKVGHEHNGDLFIKMTEVLKGDGTIRSTKPSHDLTAKEQVACLIEQATDEHILSKTYIGWQPWI